MLITIGDGMGTSENPFAYHEAMFLDLTDRLTRVLGAATVMALIDRAKEEISEAHPAVAMLRSDDHHVDVRGMECALADRTPDDIRDTFAALNGVLLLLVARLLGREVASRLTEGLTVAEYLQAVPGGIR